WLAGSCSQATLSQIAAVRDCVASFQIDPFELAADAGAAARVAELAVNALGAEPVLVYASAAAEALSKAQRVLGAERAAGLVEDAFREIAAALHAAGVRRFVIAGGETSGAVAGALKVRALVIGPEIDHGVPWTLAVGGEPLWLAMKSGNFGSQDFFAKATRMLR
ncbi:MAG: nucleotide-binding domain containing protein, partial [Caldimonas sp.]